MSDNIFGLAKENPSIPVLAATSLLAVGSGFNLALRSFGYVQFYSLVFIALGLVAFVLLTSQVELKKEE